MVTGDKSRAGFHPKLLFMAVAALAVVTSSLECVAVKSIGALFAPLFFGSGIRFLFRFYICAIASHIRQKMKEEEEKGCYLLSLFSAPPFSAP